LCDTVIRKCDIGGQDPKGICATVIYLISKLENINLLQKDIVKVLGITDQTLRNQYKRVKAFIEKL
jgi:transcription initiation factor TFIIIB Brf1 subunit/transcription initiation factor TFIIB